MTAALPGPLFFGSAIYRGSSYGRNHPLRVPRVSTVMDLATALGWLPPQSYRQSPRAKPAALAAYHTQAYLAALQKAEETGEVDDDTRRRHHLGTASNPVFPEMFRRPATGAGAVMLAAELLASHASGAIHVPGGGTHHGLPDRANGFCYLNDPVLALLSFRRAGLTRLAYVDLDAHHPDGVEPAFAGDPDLLMISVHEENRWPFTGLITDDAGGNAFNLPVPRGYNDTEARAVLHHLILPRLAAHRPQAIVLQCGADSLLEDPLSRLALSNRAYIEALTEIRPLAPRLLLLGEQPEPLLEAAHERFTQVRVPPFPLSLKSLGLFGGDKPRAAWAGVAPSEPLSRLQAKLDHAARSAGIATESRRFTPHVTLGRFPPPPPEESFRLERAIAAGSSFTTPDWRVDHFLLFESRQTKQGSVYSELARYDL